MRWVVLLALAACGRIDFEAMDPAPAPGPPKLDVYEFGACYVRGPGDVLCWGANDFGQGVEGTSSGPLVFPTQARAIPDAVAYARGEDAAYVLLPEGTVEAWGSNEYGQLGVDGGPRLTRAVVPGVTDIVRLEAIDFAVFARRADGTYVGWGRNEDGALADGGVSDRFAAVELPLLTGARRVVGDQYHACSIWEDGALYCWGNNAFGSIGVDTLEPFYATPQRVTASEGVREVAVSIRHTCAIFADTKVYCWGSNMNGQLGVEGADQARLPIEVPDTAGTERILAGEEFTCAAQAGELRCWGAVGPFGLGSAPVAIAGAVQVDQMGAGLEHVCFTRADDTSVNCFGGGAFGQLGDGTSARLAAGPVPIAPPPD